ncbi:c-type cytochrome [Herbaspirillum sp. HC18]|nr:c-type cytochrome [Herbaspirillum sp. HC18]
MLGKRSMLVAIATACLSQAPVFAVDEAAAEALARRENCLKCHGVDKDKEGPAYKRVANKYRDKPEAEAKLFKHVTTGPMVRLASGDKEEHRIIQSANEEEIKNLIQWILSR